MAMYKMESRCVSVPFLQYLKLIFENSFCGDVIDENVILTKNTILIDTTLLEDLVNQMNYEIKVDGSVVCENVNKYINELYDLYIEFKFEYLYLYV